MRVAELAFPQDSLAVVAMLLMAGGVYLVALAAIFLKPARVYCVHGRLAEERIGRDLAFAHSRGID